MRPLPSLLAALSLLAACACAAAAPAKEDISPLDAYEPRGPGYVRDAWDWAGPTSAVHWTSAAGL